MRNLIKYVALFLAIFLVVELYFRFQYQTDSSVPLSKRLFDYRYFDEEGTPRFPENTEAWHMSYGNRAEVRVKINSKGFRGADPLIDSSIKIAMVGDSIVINAGVELEESFPFLVEKNLRDKFHDSKIEVGNFGVSDINARHYHLKVKNHVLQYKPDLLLVFLYLNDGVESPLRMFPEVPEPATKWYRSEAFEQIRRLFRNLHILYQAQSSHRFDWVPTYRTHLYKQDAAIWNRMVHEARFDWGAGWVTENWNIIDQSVKAMKKLTDENNIQLWLVVLPVVPQLEISENVKDLFLPQRLAREMASSHGLILLDPLMYLRSLPQHDIFFYDQCHFTAEGNRAMADFLTKSIESWVGERGRIGMRPYRRNQP